MKWVVPIITILVAFPAWADGNDITVGFSSEIRGIMIRDNTFFRQSSDDSTVTGSCISSISTGEITSLDECAIKPILEQFDHERDQEWDEWLRARGYRK